jgi:hypothetical protein
MNEDLLQNDFSYLDHKLLDANCRIIHQIWFNFKDPNVVSSIPEKYVNMCQSWKEMNPKWVYVIWNEKIANVLIDTYYPQYKDLYNSFPKPIFRVDFIRFCFLHRYGGVYADTDAKCIKPLDNLLKKYTQEIGLSNDPINYACNCFMYSKNTNHSFWIMLMKETQKVKNPMIITGLRLSDLIMEGNYDVVVYPMSVVYWDTYTLLPWRLMHKRKAFVIHYNDMTWCHPITKVFRGGIKFMIIFILIVILIIIIAKIKRIGETDKSTYNG